MAWTFAGLWTRSVVLATVLTLAACSSLPVVVPDRVGVRTPVQLEAANGRILSPSQSKVLLGRRGLTGTQSNHFERHLALEQEVSGSPLLMGNAAVLLQDGPATYAAMFAAIKGARDHINLETFILEDDEVGRRFAELLLEKQRQGVR